MAKLTVTDRNLLRDEIINRLQKEQPPREEVLKKAIKEEGIEKKVANVNKLDEALRELNIQIESITDRRMHAILELESWVGFNKGNSSWRNYDLTKLNAYLVDKYSKAIPSHREIETALLLAQGGDDMSALMNNVIEQLKNR